MSNSNQIATPSFTAYLDWNIFNKIEKLGELQDPELKTYGLIKELIVNKKLTIPYSNAHISDLARGYLKNPEFANKHLQTITLLTGNLCMVQYWGIPKVKWHYRDPQEFLDSTLDESNAMAKSFSELLYIDDEPFLNALWDVQKSLLRLQRLDDSFKDLYKTDPIFNSIFPRTKIEMNKLALCEDLFQFSSRIKTDYVLYKSFQKFLNQIRLKFPQHQKLLMKNQQIIGKPAYLTWDNMVDKAYEQTKVATKNAAYDRILGQFTSTDIKGYSADERFANMIDDGLHCFYAAHCDYFITIDKRCADKSKRTYQTLKIQCKVVSPEEFVTIL
ncbi:MAG: hypothetical protein J0L56_10300 [Chitinophagales bacterium]|nr:hypothetical protein [Chitinophagales bacterium]